jgi:hypothetical protein
MLSSISYVDSIVYINNKKMTNANSFILLYDRYIIDYTTKRLTCFYIRVIFYLQQICTYFSNILVKNAV